MRILAVIFILITNTSALTQLVLKNDTMRMCYTDSSDEPQMPIEWVYPLQLRPYIYYEHVPGFNNKYACKFNNRDACTEEWLSGHWLHDTNSTKTKDFLNDSRWEDIPNTHVSLDNPKIFYVANDPRITFSIKSGVSSEVKVCSSIFHTTYHCYIFLFKPSKIYFTIHSTTHGNIIKRQHWNKQFIHKINILKSKQLPEEFNRSTFVNDKDWTHFELTLKKTGLLVLREKTQNVELISYNDRYNLEKSVLVLLSDGPSSWKVYNNHFLYTTVAHDAHLGPVLNNNLQQDLCVSLYVSSCAGCSMNFYYENGINRTNLTSVKSTGENWKEIRLTQERANLANVQLHIETLFEKNASETGWWAIDDVRLCHKNEIKITGLQQSATEDNDQFCCKELGYDREPVQKSFDHVGPLSINDCNTNETAISISFSNHNVFTMIYVYEIIPEEERLIAFQTTPSNSIYLGGLKPSTRYSVEVTRVVDKYRHIITVVTEDDFRIENLTLSKIDENAAYFKYNVQTNAISSPFNTSIRACPTSSKGGCVQTNLERQTWQPEFSAHIRNLKPSISYTFCLSIQYNSSKNHREAVCITNVQIENLTLTKIEENAAYFQYNVLTHSNSAPFDTTVRACPITSKGQCVTVELEKQTRGTEFNANITGLQPSTFYEFCFSIQYSFSENHKKPVCLTMGTYGTEPITPITSTTTDHSKDIVPKTSESLSGAEKSFFPVVPRIICGICILRTLLEIV